MQKLFTLLGVAALATLVAADSPLETAKAARLFDIDYRLLQTSENPADAQFAKGSPKGRVLHEPRLRFDVEPMETICHGIMVGEGCGSVRYKSEGNLNPKVGTIEILFENTQWDWDNKETHVLMQCLGKDSALYIYKYSSDGCGAYIGNTNPKWSVFPRQLVKDLSGRGPNHLLVTYSPKEIQLYFNGKLVRTMDAETELGEWNKSFEIGPSGRFGRQGRTTISTVTTYDRVLTENEVHALAKLRVPTLDLADMEATARIAVPASPLLRDPARPGLEALSDDYVVAPWTPVKRDGNKFSVWNRTYDFSGSDFVTAITNGGDQLLDSGINFIATRDGKSEKVAWSTDLEMTIDGAGRKAFRRQVVSPDYLKGSSAVTAVEYDGNIHFDLALVGIDRADRFELDVPLSRDYSDAIHYNGSGRTGLRTAVFPDMSFSKTLDNQPGVVYESDNPNTDLLVHMWVGCDKGGVQLAHNSDEAFYPKDRKDSFQVVRDEAGKSTIKVNYATAKTPAPEGKLNYSFNMIVTPVRPMPERWREWTITAQYDGFQGANRGTHLVYWPDYWGMMIPVLDPDPYHATKMERNRERIKLDHAEHRKVVPYFNHKHIGVCKNNYFNPDARYIKENWGNLPQYSQNGYRDSLRVSSASGFADYLARCVLAYSKIYGTIDGVYFDEMENTPNLRKESNGGYDDYDGKRRPTYQIFSDRDLYKRLDAIVRSQNGGEIPMSIAHCSGTYMMDILTPFPIFLVAEHLYSGFFPEHKEWIPPESDRLYYYSYSLPMDRVKTEFYHKPWGAVLVFLPCLKNQRDIMDKVEPTRDLLSRAMHGDVLFWPLWCNRDEMLKTIEFRREYDIGDPAVEFTPYWHNTLITSPQEEVYISYYDKRGDKLVIVSNTARKAQEVKVKLPAGTTEVVNAETHEKVPFADGVVKISMKRNDYCALRVK